MRTVTIRGHRPGRPSGDAPTLVSQFWSASLYNHGEIHSVSREIPKAFHRVWNQGLPSKLPTFGFSPSTVSRTAGEPSPPEFTGSRSSHFLQMLIILTVQYLRPPSFCHSVMFFCFLPQTQSIILPIAPLLLSILTALPVKQTSMLVGTVESPLYFKTPVVTTSPWSTNNHACKTSFISISLEDHSFSPHPPLGSSILSSTYSVLVLSLSINSSLCCPSYPGVHYLLHANLVFCPTPDVPFLPAQRPHPLNT